MQTRSHAPSDTDWRQQIMYSDGTVYDCDKFWFYLVLSDQLTKIIRGIIASVGGKVYVAYVSNIVCLIVFVEEIETNCCRLISVLLS